jgi:hypothetical protein
MKKKYLKYAVFSLVVILTSCSGYNKNIIKDLEVVLGDFSTSSFCIVVDVRCGTEEFPIVINNDAFYDMMLQRRLVNNQEDYIMKITKKIASKESILFENRDETILQDYSLIKNDTLSISVKKDKKAFIQKYFSNNLLKTKEISYAQEKAIIFYLFNSRIYCKKDCITGNIFIVPVNSKVKID